MFSLKINCGRLFVLLIVISFLLSSNLYSQFNLNKLKETVKNPDASSDCRMESSLKSKINSAKYHLDNYDATQNSFIESDIKWAKEYLGTVKKECPTVVVAGYESDIADIEKRYSAISAGKKGRDDAIAYIVNASNELRNIIPVTMEFRGQYAFAGIGQKFYELAKKFDYPGKYNHIIELMNQYEALLREGNYGASEYHYFMNFPKLIETNFAEFYKKEINLAIEKVYEQKSAGRLSDALASAESAQKYCEGLLEFTPNFQDLVLLKNDADNAVSKMGSAQGASVYSSDFHKQNVGKILFSKSPIEVKKENPSAFTTEFKCSDNIWGIMYLKDSFKNLTYSNNFDVNQYINVDGNQLTSYTFKMSPEKIVLTYLITEVIVPPDKAVTEGVKTYVKGLSTISPRTHKVEVVVQIRSETVAKGEFTFDCSDGVEPLEKMNQDYETLAFKSVVMPQPAKRDAKVEAEMLKAISDWPETPLKAVITDEDWTINRNVFGVIEYRSISAAVAVKKQDGKCRLFWLTFKQVYTGSSYGKTQYHAVGDSEDMPCENVK